MTRLNNVREYPPQPVHVRRTHDDQRYLERPGQLLLGRDLLCVVLALKHPSTFDVGAIRKQPVGPLGAGRIELRMTRPSRLALMGDRVGCEPVVDRLLEQ